MGTVVTHIGAILLCETFPYVTDILRKLRLDLTIQLCNNVTGYSNRLHVVTRKL
jgi:hypothetical protein